VIWHLNGSWMDHGFGLIPATDGASSAWLRSPQAPPSFYPTSFQVDRGTRAARSTRVARKSPAGFSLSPFPLQTRCLLPVCERRLVQEDGCIEAPSLALVVLHEEIICPFRDRPTFKGVFSGYSEIPDKAVSRQSGSSSHLLA
jgi:hypothetical protein